MRKSLQVQINVVLLLRIVALTHEDAPIENVLAHKHVQKGVVLLLRQVRLAVLQTRDALRVFSIMS
jgi:hypothetical protein